MGARSERSGCGGRKTGRGGEMRGSLGGRGMGGSGREGAGVEGSRRGERGAS